MSVKTMSPDQIRNDLRVIALTWGDSVPWEQIDRVNALRAELKRRGEPLENPAGRGTQNLRARELSTMTASELESDLRALSDVIAVNPKDESAQQRFADVRYELRNRAKGPSTEAPPSAPPLPPPVLELPPEDEVPTPRRALLPSNAPEIVDELRAYGLGERPALKQKPRRTASVRGYKAFARADGCVVLRYQKDLGDEADDGGVVVSVPLELDEVKALVALLTSAHLEASALT